MEISDWIYSSKFKGHLTRTFNLLPFLSTLGLLHIYTGTATTTTTNYMYTVYITYISQPSSEPNTCNR